MEHSLMKSVSDMAHAVMKGECLVSDTEHNVKLSLFQTLNAVWGRMLVSDMEHSVMKSVLVSDMDY